MLFWYDNTVETPSCVYGATSGRSHKGIDVSTSSDNLNVYATCPGTAILVADASRDDWGNYVCIQDDEENRHYYCHLATASVAEGQQVAAGDVIGVVGSSGKTTPGQPALYLHYEVRTPGYGPGDAVDPTPWCRLPNAVGTTWNHPAALPGGPSADTPAPAPSSPLNHTLYGNIEFYRSDSQLMNDAIDRLVVRVHAYREQYHKKTLLLTGCASASGTSMLAINLSIALSLAGWKTLLVDADLRKGNRYKRLGKELDRGLSNYLEKPIPLQDTIYATNHPNLSYVPCGASGTSAVRLLCSEKMNTFIAQVSTQYDFVIFDCPAVTVVPDATVLFPSVDGIALIAALENTTKKQLALAKREAAKISDKYYGLIINCVDKKQYGVFFPQYDYFDKKKMRKQHKKWIKQETREKRQGGNG